MKFLAGILVVFVIIWILCRVDGDLIISRNEQFVQFPKDSKLPVKLSISGYIDYIEDGDETMTAIVSVITSVANSVRRCFCDIHNPDPITAVSVQQIDAYRYNYTFQYKFNSYLLHALLSGDGIRCYIYDDNVLSQFQLVYNNTKPIQYTEPIESRFEILNVLNKAPHIVWLSSIIAGVVFALILFFPSLLWLYTTCTCNKQ